MQWLKFNHLRSKPWHNNRKISNARVRTHKRYSPAHRSCVAPQVTTAWRNNTDACRRRWRRRRRRKTSHTHTHTNYDTASGARILFNTRAHAPKKTIEPCMVCVTVDMETLDDDGPSRRVKEVGVDGRSIGIVVWNVCVCMWVSWLSVERLQKCAAGWQKLTCYYLIELYMQNNLLIVNWRYYIWHKNNVWKQKQVETRIVIYLKMYCWINSELN